MMPRTVAAPPSKSMTQRAMLCAAMARGVSRLKQAAICDDTSAMCEVLGHLGVNFSLTGNLLSILGLAGAPQCGTPVRCDIGASGTGLRFLTALCAAGAGTYTFVGTDRMSERPVLPLMEALRTLGCCFITNGGKAFPFTMHAGGLSGSRVTVDCSLSGQFLSALLLIAPILPEPLTIVPAGPVVSWPYVRMTIAMMNRFGPEIRMELRDDKGWRKADPLSDVPALGSTRFQVTPQPYSGTDVIVEGDWSAAAPFLADGALHIPTAVTGLTFASLQADAAITDILRRMGAHPEWKDGSLSVTPVPLQAVTQDMTNCPDLFPVLAVLCAHADGRSILTGLSHIRTKESDRVHEIAKALTSCGVRVDESANTMLITGIPDPLRRPKATTTLHTCGDHRLAMAYALINGAPSLIDDKACVGKSFPEFFCLWTRTTK